MKKSPAGFVRSLAAIFFPAMLLTLMDVSAQAASGTWITTTSGGLWGTNGNWAGGTVANGAGSTANFASIDITADNTVHLDSARTLSGLVFGDTTTNTPAGWTLDNNGNPANTLTLSNGLITVVPLGGTRVATLSVILTGTNSLTKVGSGTLVLSASNSYTGNTTISNGNLTLSGSGAVNSSPSVSVSSGATFNVLAGGYTVSAGHVLTGAGSVLNGTVTVASGGILAPGDAGACGTLTMSGLILSNGATNNFEFPVSGANDLVNATNLTLNGGAFNLYQIGATTPFTRAGTYNLFQYSGGVGGVGIGSLSVANPQSGFSYTFGSTGTFITLSITNNNALPASALFLSVHSVDGSILAVRFSGQVQGASANNKTNYTVYSKTLSATGINVTNAVLLSDEQTVVLNVDTPVSEFFAVGVSNVLDLGNSNVVADATGYLGDLLSTNIGTVGDPTTPGSVIDFYREAFQVTASGSDIGGTDDHCQFIYQNNSGNFETIANITSLAYTNPGTKAFLMARESLAPGGGFVAIGFTAINPSSNTNQVLILARSISNTTAQAFGSPPQQNSLGWLRMTRTNNAFTVYYGSNGLSWTPCGSFSNVFSNIMSVGIAVTSHANGHPIAAGVTSFGLDGTLPGTGVVPTLSVSIYSNNLVAKWQRTPRDFAIQVTDSLVGNSSGGTSNLPSAWVHLLLPIFDTSLTGTNRVMPTPGRYMTIPMNLFSNNQMFVRLTQVERVIPDPVMVTPGILLSQGAGNMSANSSPAFTLGGYNINPTNSVIVSSTNYLVCNMTNTYTFYTDESTNLRTVLMVKRLNANNTTTIIATNGGESSEGKARISLPYSTATTNYTVILAATNGYTPSGSFPLRLRIEYK